MKLKIHLILLCSVFLLLLETNLYADEQNVDFRQTFKPESFKMNKDVQRVEMATNGKIRVLVRVPATAIQTRFPLDQSSSLAFWRLTADVHEMDRASAGISLGDAKRGIAFVLAPDGLVSLSYQEEGQVRWTEERRVSGFQTPLELTLERDALGSVFAKINDFQVLSRPVTPLDLSRRVPFHSTFVALITQSLKNDRDSSVSYGEISVTGWGRISPTVQAERNQ